MKDNYSREEIIEIFKDIYASQNVADKIRETIVYMFDNVLGFKTLDEYSATVGGFLTSGIIVGYISKKLGIDRTEYLNPDVLSSLNDFPDFKEDL